MIKAGSFVIAGFYISSQHVLLGRPMLMPARPPVPDSSSQENMDRPNAEELESIISLHTVWPTRGFRNNGKFLPTPLSRSKHCSFRDCLRSRQSHFHALLQN